MAASNLIIGGPLSLPATGHTLASAEVDDDAALTNYFNGPRTEENAQQWDRAKETITREERARQILMSPPGALGLPPLLDARRREWRITDGAFKLQAVYDRVLLHQIPTNPSGKMGLIHMTDVAKKSDLRTAPRGVLVSAGLTALDALRSHGIDLGHIVRYIHVAPWRLQIDYSEGFRPELLVMTAGDITASEDLADIVRSGAAKVTVSAHGLHQLTDQEGKTWDPVMPWVPADK